MSLNDSLSRSVFNPKVCFTVSHDSSTLLSSLQLIVTCQPPASEIFFLIYDVLGRIRSLLLLILSSNVLL